MIVALIMIYVVKDRIVLDRVTVDFSTTKI